MTQTDTTKRPSALTKVMRYVIPLVITVGLCWVMFSNIPFGEMLDIISRECDFSWIALAMALSLFAHVIRALRWRLQLLALGIDAPRWELVLSIFGTYAVNIVFPRLGEVWRCGFVAQRQRAPFASVFGSMVAERLADTITALLLMVVTFIAASSSIISYVKENEAVYRSITSILASPWLWAALVLCMAAAWWLLTRKSASGSLLSRIQDFARGLWQGFAVIISMPGKVRWLLYTLLIWGCYFVQLYVAFYAFPFTADALAAHGTIVALLAFTLSSISMGVPSNGGIGPWQFAVIFALGIYGINQVDAAAFANLVLGSQTLLMIVLGIFTFIAIMLTRNRTTGGSGSVPPQAATALGDSPPSSPPQNTNTK